MIDFTKDGVVITEEEWNAYEGVRQSGCYNMVMQARDVMRETGIESKQYWFIIKNYNEIKNHFD